MVAPIEQPKMLTPAEAEDVCARHAAGVEAMMLAVLAGKNPRQAYDDAARKLAAMDLGEQLGKGNK